MASVQKWRTAHRSALLIATAAICASLLFSFLIFPLVSEPLNLNVDPDKLGELGRNLAEGRGFSYGTGSSAEPAFDRGPVYPLLVMVLSRIAGGDPLTLLQVIQAVFHGCTGFLLYHIGMTVFDRRTALLAQSIHAVHPILIWYTARIWIETTHTLLITAFVFSLILVWRRPTWRVLAVCAVLFALTALTKSVILPVPLMLLLFAFMQKAWSYARSVALVCLLGLVLIFPWTMRNFVLSGRVIPVHTSLGLNLIQGEAIADEWTTAPWSSLAIWEKGRQQMELLLGPKHLQPESPEGDATLVYAVLQRWWTHPMVLLRHVGTNAITYWYLSESPLKSAAVIVLQIPLLMLAAAGIRRAGRKGPAARTLVIVVIVYWCVHACIVGWLRYSVPAMPLGVLLAAAGGVSVFETQQQRRQSTRTT